jgi:hypothetical protein
MIIMCEERMLPCNDGRLTGVMVMAMVECYHAKLDDVQSFSNSMANKGQFLFNLL